MPLTNSQISPMTFVDLTPAFGSAADMGRSAGYEQLIGAGSKSSVISPSPGG